MLIMLRNRQGKSVDDVQVINDIALDGVNSYLCLVTKHHETRVIMWIHRGHAALEYQYIRSIWHYIVTINQLLTGML